MTLPPLPQAESPKNMGVPLNVRVTSGAAKAKL